MKKNPMTALLCLGGALLFPIFFTDPYFLHMAILIGIYGLLAVSLNLLFRLHGAAFPRPFRILRGGRLSFFLGLSESGHSAVGRRGNRPGRVGAAWIFRGRLAFKLRGAYFVIMTIASPRF